MDKYSTKSEQEEQKKTWTRRGGKGKKERNKASQRVHDGSAEKMEIIKKVKGAEWRRRRALKKGGRLLSEQ